MKKIFLTIAILTTLTACGHADTQNNDTVSIETEQAQEKEISQKEEPIKNVYYGFNYRIYVDTHTNVMYWEKDDAYGTGLTVMLNADGTPRLYNGEFEE